MTRIWMNHHFSGRHLVPLDGHRKYRPRYLGEPFFGGRVSSGRRHLHEHPSSTIGTLAGLLRVSMAVVIVFSLVSRSQMPFQHFIGHGRYLDFRSRINQCNGRSRNRLNSLLHAHGAQLGDESGTDGIY